MRNLRNLYLMSISALALVLTSAPHLTLAEGTRGGGDAAHNGRLLDFNEPVFEPKKAEAYAKFVVPALDHLRSQSPLKERSHFDGKDRITFDPSQYANQMENCSARKYWTLTDETLQGADSNVNFPDVRPIAVQDQETVKISKTFYESADVKNQAALILSQMIQCPRMNLHTLPTRLTTHELLEKKPVDLSILNNQIWGRLPDQWIPNLYTWAIGRVVLDLYENEPGRRFHPFDSREKYAEIVNSKLVLIAKKLPRFPEVLKGAFAKNWFFVDGDLKKIDDLGVVIEGTRQIAIQDDYSIYVSRRWFNEEMPQVSGGEIDQAGLIMHEFAVNLAKQKGQSNTLNVRKLNRIIFGDLETMTSQALQTQIKNLGFGSYSTTDQMIQHAGKKVARLDRLKEQVREYNEIGAKGGFDWKNSELRDARDQMYEAASKVESTIGSADWDEDFCSFGFDLMGEYVCRSDLGWTLVSTKTPFGKASDEAVETLLQVTLRYKAKLESL